MATKWIIGAIVAISVIGAIGCGSQNEPPIGQGDLGTFTSIGLDVETWRLRDARPTANKDGWCARWDAATSTPAGFDSMVRGLKDIYPGLSTRDSEFMGFLLTGECVIAGAD